MVAYYGRVGGEFLLNTSTFGNQGGVSVTTLTSGGFAAAYYDSGDGDTNSPLSGIRAQFFDAAGSKLGPELLANTNYIGTQYLPSIQGLSNGGVVVTWTDFSAQSGDPSSSAVRGQIYDAFGAKVGGEFLVNTSFGNAQQDSQVAALAGGGFVVTWTDASGQGGDNSLTSIKAQIFSATGAKVGGEFLVNTATSSIQQNSNVITLASGGFIVSWADGSGAGGDSSGTGIKAQLFDSAGAKVGGEFLVNTTTQLNQLLPNIAPLSSGGFVIAWSDGSNLAADPANGINAQLFDANGARVGAEFRVNTTTTFAQVQPTITSLPSGGFAVAWVDIRGELIDVKAQIYSAAGVPEGGEFTVNTATGGYQQAPAITALPTGEIVVVWDDGSGVGGDASMNGVKGQIFRLTDEEVTSFDLNVINPLFESHVEGLAFASLAPADGPANGGYVYELLSESSGGAIALIGDQLVVVDNEKLDFETTPEISISVRMSDLQGKVFDKDFVLNVTDDQHEARFDMSAPFLVNSTTQSTQAASASASIPGMYSLVVWQDSSLQGDNSLQGIKGQYFDETGQKLGAEFQVNSTISSAQVVPDVVAVGNAFFVTWTDYSGQGGDASGSSIKVKMLAPSLPSSADILVNTTTLGAQTAASLHALANGSIVVTWTDASGVAGDASGQSIQGRVIFGSSAGPQFLINTTTTGAQAEPEVTALANGGFVVSWEDSSGQGGDASGKSIKAQVFDGAGAKFGAEFLVNTTTAGDQAGVSLAAMEDGGFVAVWAGGDGLDISAQRFDDSGAKVGPELLVNTETSGWQTAPVVVAVPGGGFFVGWQTNFLDIGDLKGQFFAADGSKAGHEFRINQSTANTQSGLAVSVISDNQLMATWSDGNFISGDVSDLGIVGRIITLHDEQNAGAPTGTPTAILADGEEDQPYTVSESELLEGFVDPNGDTLQVASVDALDTTVINNGDGTFTFTPYVNTNGPIFITYKVVDGNGGEIEAEQQFYLNPVNDAPTGAPTFALSDGVEDEEYSVGFSALTIGFSDVEDDTLTVANLVADHGTVVMYADSAYITPDANYNGPMMLTYDVVDGNGGSVQATHSYVVQPVNDGIGGSATGVLGGGVEDQPYLVQAATLLQGLVDFAGGTLSVANVTATEGAVTNNGDGTYTITPFANANGPVTINYTVQNELGDHRSLSKTYQVQAVNDAPSNIALSINTVLENAAAGTTVGALTATDVDSPAVTNFTLIDSAGGRFVIDAGTLKVAAGAALDYETATSHQITVRATDADGASFDKTFTLQVQDVADFVNQAPTDLTLEGGSILENASNLVAVGKVTGVDPNAGDVLSYSLVNDAGGRFGINASTGQIFTLNGALLDYESATSHNITVRVQDAAGLTYQEVLTINVTDRPDSAPTDLILEGGSVIETALSMTNVATVTAVDPDNSGGLIFSLLDDAGGRFVIDPYEGIIQTAEGAAFDRDVTTNHSITVQVSDASGSYQESFTIQVLETPSKSWTGTDGYDYFGAPDGSHWTVNAKGGDDIIETNEGDDTIRGGLGNDQIWTSGGDDVITFKGSEGFDLVVGGDGYDTIKALAKSTVIGLVHVSGVEKITANGYTGVTIAGSAVGDFLDFTDTQLVGIGRISTGAGEDIIYGSSGNDVIAGGADHDELYGADGDDVFEIGAGAGFDYISGGEGYDRISITTSGLTFQWGWLSSIEALSGKQTMIVGADYTFVGDTLDFSGVTLTGVSQIDGLSGDDTVTGSSAADVIALSYGQDTLTGGGGADIFDLDFLAESLVGAADTITDFEQGIDRISLTNVDANVNKPKDQAFTFLGTGAFTNKAGQLRIEHSDASSTEIFGDVNGDGVADFQINLSTYVVMQASDFSL